MAEGSLHRIVDLADTWSTRKIPLAAAGTTSSLNEFVAALNAITGQFMSELGRKDPEFYASLAELANNAIARIEQAKIFVNGSDRTNS